MYVHGHVCMYYLLRKGGYVSCSFVSMITQNYSTYFHKIQWRGAWWHMGQRIKRLDFGGNLNHVTLGVGLGLRLG